MESFWESPEQVDAFADRVPDRRLAELLESYASSQEVRVLDLGCAGGRNTMLLAERGFDVHGIDSSVPMVDRTRYRLSAVLDLDEAERRVRIGDMGDLGEFRSGSVHLVVALGVYHNATSREQWDRALAETARVLTPGGLVLVANFSPASQPSVSSLRRVPAEEHVYEGFRAGRMFLLHADELDAEMAQHGLIPVEPTFTVEAPTEPGRRVTVNGLYRKCEEASNAGRVE